MPDFSIVSTWIDPFMIWVFRIPSNPWIGFAVGLFYAALIATIIGELCMAGAYFFNKDAFAKTNAEMVRHNNMSLRSLIRQDKASYKVLNNEANEQFGKNFFSRIALFGSSLFPAFFVMGWLDMRFARVTEFIIPGLGEVGPGFFFVPTYIAVRVLFAKTKKYLPLFSAIEQKVLENEATPEDLITIEQLDKEARGDRPELAIAGPDYKMPG